MKKDKKYVQRSYILPIEFDKTKYIYGIGSKNANSTFFVLD